MILLLPILLVGVLLIFNTAHKSVERKFNNNTLKK